MEPFSSSTRRRCRPSGSATTSQVERRSPWPSRPTASDSRWWPTTMSSDVIDVASGAIEPHFMESVDASFTSVAWSPRGDRIATGANGGTVQIWDATSLKRAAPPGRVNSIGVGGVAFSSDGSLVASTSAFAVTQLWLTDTGAPFGGPLVGGDPPIRVESLPPPERPDLPFVPSFAPDGSAVYVGSDHPMQWSLEPAIWATAACAIAGRELTATEWAASCGRAATPNLWRVNDRNSAHRRARRATNVNGSGGTRRVARWIRTRVRPAAP